MALTIKGIPTLKSKEAKDFISRAEASIAKKGSVDFSKQLESTKRILEKAKL
ncbi:MAG: hypothetical protein IPP61_02150 [Cytophagaceae bacterium]|nr:hypothetical protein [Cytophagaceae bacterium]MBK9934719.1 hypothetical protein [Cytophagaceae bacterium]MBL0301157.1 hypothetical protein [Cytophagaceae bacterium]MBL0323974.1 hypothetical protein [Cytophagaceae bacterium]